MLTPVHGSSPSADLRVLVLTDGQNNAGAAPQVRPSHDAARHDAEPRHRTLLTFRCAPRGTALIWHTLTTPFWPRQVALAAANQIGAVVDAIIVGDSPDGDLRRIVAATGGQCYQIHDLGAGFELLEAEAVVSLRARRGGSDKPPFVPKETPTLADFGKLEQVGRVWAARAAAQLQGSQGTGLGNWGMQLST